MKRLIAVILFALAPVPALSLSCIAPTVTGSFARFDAAAETYVVARGVITFDESALPPVVVVEPPPPALTNIPGQFEGVSLASEGFERPFSDDITVSVTCMGPWCGTARSGADILAFLRLDGAGYTLEVTPCPGTFFEAPTKAQMETAQRCFVERDCEQG